MWKYIVVRYGSREIPLIFPSHMVHSIMLEAVKCYLAEEIRITTGFTVGNEQMKEIMDKVTVVSAGGVNIPVMYAGGFSTTLGIGSRPTDSAFLSSYPYTGGHIVGEIGKSAE